MSIRSLPADQGRIAPARVTKLYHAPDIEAPALRQVAAENKALNPDTPVVIINRGNTAVCDRYDGEPWEVPPGHWTVPYAVAKHLQNRAVVPGSRDPVSGRQSSFIGIVGLDSADRCRPFTPEQMKRFGLAVDAIDPAARSEAVTLVDVNDVRARLLAEHDVDLDDLAGQQADPAAFTPPPREEHTGLQLNAAGEAAKRAARARRGQAAQEPDGHE